MTHPKNPKDGFWDRVLAQLFDLSPVAVTVCLIQFAILFVAGKVAELGCGGLGALKAQLISQNSKSAIDLAGVVQTVSTPCGAGLGEVAGVVPTLTFSLAIVAIFFMIVIALGSIVWFAILFAFLGAIGGASQLPTPWNGIAIVAVLIIAFWLRAMGGGGGRGSGGANQYNA